MREVVKSKMTIEENSSRRRTTKSSGTVLLSAIFMVLMWVVLLVLIPLRRGGSGSVPIDFIVNATNTPNSSWNSYKYSVFVFSTSFAKDMSQKKRQLSQKKKKTLKLRKTF